MGGVEGFPLLTIAGNKTELTIQKFATEGQTSGKIQSFNSLFASILNFYHAQFCLIQKPQIIIGDLNGSIQIPICGAVRIENGTV